MKKFNPYDYPNDGLESSNNPILFHLSTRRNIKSLSPRIPYTVSSKENQLIKRVCFSPSINGCISAIWPRRSKLYVYIPAKDIDIDFIKVPSLKDCYDCKETLELWITNQVPVICIGWIDVSMVEFTIEQSFNYIKHHYAVIKHKWKIGEIDPKYIDVVKAAEDFQNIYRYNKNCGRRR